MALRDGGFIDYADNAITPTDLVVVVTGDEFGPDSGAQGALVGRFAAAMAARGVGGVLVGRTGSASGGSPIAIVRSDPSLANAVSTVDNIDQPTGLITTILALTAEVDGTTWFLRHRGRRDRDHRRRRRPTRRLGRARRLERQYRHARLRCGGAASGAGGVTLESRR